MEIADVFIDQITTTTTIARDTKNLGNLRRFRNFHSLIFFDFWMFFHFSIFFMFSIVFSFVPSFWECAKDGQMSSFGKIRF